MSIFFRIAIVGCFTGFLVPSSSGQTVGAGSQDKELRRTAHQ
jgi:hypothetical protein